MLFIDAGTTLNEKEEDEKGFEWLNNSNHPRIYATTAVAEQNSLSTFNSNTMFIPKEVLSQPWPNVYAQVGRIAGGDLKYLTIYSIAVCVIKETLVVVVFFFNNPN